MATGYASKVVVDDQQVSWANSAAAGTEQLVDVAFPSNAWERADEYLVAVQNPSTETALTVQLQIQLTLGGVATWVTIGTFTVAADSVVAHYTSNLGFGLGDAGRLRFVNDSAVGMAGAFSADVSVLRGVDA